jgi:hypothetical protein
MLRNPRSRPMILPTMVPNRRSLALIVSFVLTLLSFGLSGCGGGTMPQVTSQPPAVYPFVAGPSPIWIQQFGASSLFVNLPNQTPVTTEVLRSIASDANGNVIAAGYVVGSFNNYPNPGFAAECYVIKFDQNGNLQWVKQFGTGSADFLNSVTVDSTGSIFAVGTTQGAITGASNPTHEVESVAYKLDSGGNLLWQTQFTVDSSYTNAGSIRVDQAGNLVIAGTFSPIASPTASNLFIRKLSAGTGMTLWTSQFGTQAFDYFSALTLDNAGDIYFAGTTSGPFPGASTGAVQPFLSKVSGATGNALWNIRIANGSSGNLYPFGLTANALGVTVAGAISSGGIAIGLAADSASQGFINQYSTTDGSLKWNKLISSGAGDEITDIAATQSGTFVLTGNTNGLLAPGFTQPTNNVFLAQIAQDGTNLSAIQLGTGPLLNGGVPNGPVIATGPTGQVYVGVPTQGSYAGFQNTKNEFQMAIIRYNRN